MSDHPSLTIVTGASSNHFPCLKNLLDSVSLFEPETRTVAYDLGLTAPEAAQLDAKNVVVRKFDYSRYPAYIDIRVDAGQYAWKPIIVADALREFGGMVLWLDSGNLIHAPLARVRSALLEQGLYCPVSSGTVERWTHPTTLSGLGVASDMLARPQLNAAIVGLMAGRPGVDELAQRWKACALNRDCIAPPGSDRSNHRQDQAILTILIHQFAEQYGCKLQTERLDVSTHNDGLSPRKARGKTLPAPSLLAPLLTRLKRAWTAAAS